MADEQGPWNDYAATPAAAPAAAGDGPWSEYAAKKEPTIGETAEDVTKGLTQNVAPNAAVNIGAGAVSAPYTVGSYALQLGLKGGQYVGEGADSLVRLAQGKQQKSQKDYDAEQLDLMNAIRSKFGMEPTTSGDISRLAPTPSRLLEAGAEAVGDPLYQPHTKPGEVITNTANMASAGAGSGVKLMSALTGALGAETFQEAVKHLGGPEAAQFVAGLLGGAAGAKGAGAKSGESAMSRNEDAAIDTLMAKEPGKNPQGLGSEDLRTMAKPAYDYAEKQGAVLDTNFTNDALKSMRGNIDESARVTRALGETAAHKFVNGIEEEYANTPMSLNDATDIIQRLNDEINKETNPKTGKLYNTGRQLFGMKVDLMDKIDNAGDNGQVMGGPGAFDAWKTGQNLWARSMRAGEVERVIGRGIDMETGQPLMDNPDTAIRVGFRNLVNNKKLFNKYEPAEQEFLMKASQTGVGGELLRAAGSRLATQGLLAMGHIPFAIGNVILSKGWRDIAGRARAGQGQKVIDEIVAGAKQFEPPPPPPPPAQLQLPPPSPGDQFIADPVGGMRQLGGTEAFVMDQRRQQIANMGRTPDVVQAGLQHPGAPPEEPGIAAARKSMEEIAQTGKASPPQPQPAPQPAQAALPPPQPGQEMIAGPEGTRQSTQSEDWANAQHRQKDMELGITPDIRAAIAQHFRPSIDANLSAATSTIPGLDRLVNSANNGDAGAHQMLNKVAQDSLERLMSGIPSARVDVTPSSGLYGGSLEPSLGVKLLFNEQDRPAVLSSLAKFAQNFNQEQVHVRGDADQPVGFKYDDGSYATPVTTFALKQPMPREAIEKIAKEAGLSGFTASDNALETYYVGDPHDQAGIKSFIQGSDRARELLGENVAGAGSKISRLWNYGDQGGSIPYRSIDGDFRAPKETNTDIPKLIGERHTGAPITPAEQKAITPSQRRLQERIAKTYDALPENDLANPLVQRAYDALATEVKQQFQNLPIKVEVWSGNGEPYGNSKAMRQDLLNNNHLYIFRTTPENFGPHGSDFSAHPLLQESGLKSTDGTPLLMNDLLRAVHDYYAHTTSPVDFGPKGEEAAWRNHMASTKDPFAKWALTSETRGQNSWVNFRPGVTDLPLNERQFAVQKAALLPLKDAFTGDPKVDASLRKLSEELSPADRNGSLRRKFASGGRISDAQASAGNYKKEHIAVHGLPISIETKGGKYRHGKDNSWRVKMPCHYGYFKRTEGADGDHVDCFIGPHPKSDRVFVINQVDHKSKAFDEHKVMLGFVSEKQARAYYEKAFSDGNGAKRIGSVKHLNVQQLKDWLRSGNTKRAA